MTSGTEPRLTEAVQDAPPLTVVGFDHLVLRVADPDRALKFYVGVLGLIAERVEEWRAGTVPFPSVRIDASTVIDLDARNEASGRNVDHFCLEIAPTDLRRIAEVPGIVFHGGPVRRWGARGEADLVYVRDPDGNVIELRHYGPTQGFGYQAT